MNKTKNLVWIDLEMTGLDPQKNVILEIATIITDSQLQEIAVGPSLVIHHPEEALQAMNDEVKKILKPSGLLELVPTSTISTQQAEEETLGFIKQYCVVNTAVLCGNSVWMDRSFLKQHMPRIDAFLNYRIIDVSSIKEVVNRWYAKNPNAEFKKKNLHRALDDIRESIAELQHYRNQFFVKI